MSIRILIAEAREIVRRGISDTCAENGMEIVGEITRTDELASASQRTRPDVLLADPRLPGGDCLEVLERLKLEMPNLRMVLLADDESATLIGRSRGIGATDYVTFQSSAASLIEVIQRAARGESAQSGSLLHAFKEKMLRPRTDAETQTPLTERELQVLRHVAHGLSNREIGGSLGISIETVKEHVQNILRKIDVKDRTQAAVWAVKGGFV
jgi:DNA-binding NarL/FixJ family response regulator